VNHWPQITAGVLLFTLLLDAVDLAPQIKSLRFIASSTYAVFYVLHVAIGLLAATVLVATRAIDNPFVLAFVAVLSSVAVLENVVVRFGGQDIVDISSVFETYRAAMIAEQAERVFRSDQSTVFSLASKLRGLPPTKLRTELTTMLAIALGPEEAQARIGKIEQLASEDEDLLKTIMVSDMVQVNADYVRRNLRDWLETYPPASS